jgi:cytochrome bd ubiquinol oxidase subunit I
LTIALTIGGVTALVQPISGDLIAKAVAVHQPAKFAAMEALFNTETGANFVLGGLPDAATRTVPYAPLIPSGLSILLYGDPRAEVSGLDRVPYQDWPPVAVVHLAFQLMVVCGLLMTGLALWSGWRWWTSRELAEDRRLLQALVFSAPLGFIAIEAGWGVTEVGRQPWIINQVMRTSEAVTPMPGLWIPLMTFTWLYLVLGGVVLWALWRHIAATYTSVGYMSSTVKDQNAQRA